MVLFVELIRNSMRIMRTICRVRLKDVSLILSVSWRMQQRMMSLGLVSCLITGRPSCRRANFPRHGQAVFEEPGRPTPGFDVYIQRKHYSDSLFELDGRWYRARSDLNYFDLILDNDRRSLFYEYLLNESVCARSERKDVLPLHCQLPSRSDATHPSESRRVDALTGCY
jgi:hypothetical protein